jgi:hypothetical protein
MTCGAFEGRAKEIVSFHQGDTLVCLEEDTPNSRFVSHIFIILSNDILNTYEVSSKIYFTATRVLFSNTCDNIHVMI